MDIPTTVKITNSERNSVTYLEKIRWTNGIICPKCYSLKAKSISYRDTNIYYRCGKCYFRFTLFTGTYLNRCKLKPSKLILLVKLFSLGPSARITSKELGLNYRTVLFLFNRIRQAILYHNRSQDNLFGEVELDETYVGGKRKGKRGRGAKGKTPVFGMLERNGKVIVEVVPDVSSDTLRQIIKERVSKDARVYTDIR